MPTGPIAPTRRVLGIIMAGGKGERLYPLTHERSKPSVPFGGKYRIVDFVLSNFVNSGIHSIYILVQYMSQSLIDYLRGSWHTVGLTRDQFITVVPPQMRLGDMWYRGTADAVRQNLNLIRDFDPDMVAVFGADHIYRMDIGQMMQFHMERGAEITIATIPVPLKSASFFGIVEVDAKGKVATFVEKPENPKPLPGDAGHALSSMGNYLFNTDVLVRILEDETAQANLDFGKSILPDIHKKFKAYAYDFSTNVLPGLKPYEEKGYWRDVGALSSYYQANMDILGARPKINLNNRKWFIHAGSYEGPPAKIIDGKFSNCIIGDGCFLRDAAIKNSILGRGVHVHDGAIIEDSIVMDFCKIRSEAKLKRVIVDRFNDIPSKETIGHSAAKDAERYFVDASGIVVLPRGKTTPPVR
ncbi:MAG: glucose-1-phosphate adenylyltransferase [Elusimicrobia bacterium RIFCSPHIGHO2_02_FULL_57_9]|nr:MAG: glucose-1-phosphate adenylyltransferase [Elusimicrobia bacterium RIFCSPHIGHO2_02_FULL_57_9]